MDVLDSNNHPKTEIKITRKEKEPLRELKYFE